MQPGYFLSQLSYFLRLHLNHLHILVQSFILIVTLSELLYFILFAKIHVLRRFDLLDLVHQDLKVSEQSEHVILE
jgi:hypothetical protein